MKKKYLILATLFIVLFVTSCTQEDAVTPPVTFDGLSISKNIAFTEDSILLTIEGENFDETKFNFSDTSVTATKIEDFVYEIKSNKKLKGVVEVILTNDVDEQSKTIEFEFIEHGVSNSNTVEGIRIDRDSSDRLLEVLGEPDLKLESNSGNSIFWYYSFGVIYTEVKANKRITAAIIPDRSRVITSEGNEDVLIKPYPYLVNGIFDFSDSEPNTMDEIVDELKLPTIIHTNGAFPEFVSSIKRELRAPTETSRGLYQYIYFFDRDNDYIMAVTFFANSIDEYKGEFVSTISIF